MLAEENPRQRIENEDPEAVILLDFLATRVRPFTDGKGWTVFNDWLDMAHKKTFGRLFSKQQSLEVLRLPHRSLDQLHTIVFPAA